MVAPHPLLCLGWGPSYTLWSAECHWLLPTTCQWHLPSCDDAVSARLAWGQSRPQVKTRDVNIVEHVCACTVSGLFPLGAADIGGCVIVAGGSPVPCKILSSVPGFHPLEPGVSLPPVLTTPVSPDVTPCPRAGHSHSWWRTKSGRPWSPTIQSYVS